MIALVMVAGLESPERELCGNPHHSSNNLLEDGQITGTFTFNFQVIDAQTSNFTITTATGVSSILMNRNGTWLNGSSGTLYDFVLWVYI
ncbi:MAG TPA: hypothetical protein VKK79_25825 [Candidatus Lokiarchaeia archaeon]|nr:hypothetical protein [Candidatus Lokiarchaeia archaeon]